MNLSNIKSRKDFVKVIDYFGHKTGAEIGVCKGENASWILDNSKLEILYGVENWSVKGCRKCQIETENKMQKYVQRFKWIVGDSVIKASEFSDNSLDFIYIDGNHLYHAVKKDLEAWYPKIKTGGLFSGHDYVIARKCGVIKAVDEFFSSIKRGFLLTAEDPSETNISFWMIK